MSMNITKVAERLQLLQTRDMLAASIGANSERIGNGQYSTGSGCLGELGFLRGRIIGLDYIIAGSPKAKPETKARLLARAQEQNHTLIAQAIFEKNAAITKRNEQLAVLKATQKELDLAENAIKRFDADNPDLAAMSESELQTLLDQQSAANSNTGDEPDLTSDNVQARIADEHATATEADEAVEQYLTSTS